MEKTEVELRAQCLSNLNKEFNVIVTGTIPGYELDKVGLQPIEGLENIYSGALKGKQILQMEKLENIDRIELDKNMEIL